MGNGRQVIWNGRKLGWITEGAKGFDFVSPRKASHKFRMFDGWGLSKELTKELEASQCQRIKIFVDNGKRILVSTPSKWLAKGVPYRAKDFEEQLVLREKDFDMVFE